MRRAKDRSYAGVCGASVSQQWLKPFFLHLPQTHLTLLLWFLLLYTFFPHVSTLGGKKSNNSNHSVPSYLSYDQNYQLFFYAHQDCYFQVMLQGNTFLSLKRKDHQRINQRPAIFLKQWTRPFLIVDVKP